MTRESTLSKPPSLPAKRNIVRPAMIGILAVALLVAGGQLPDFRVSQIASMLIFAIAISGLNLVAGYGGMLSLGHSALFGVGGYTTAILISEMRLTPLSTMPIAIALGVLVGALMGLPATRVKGIYLALVTLAFAVAFPEFLRRFEELTGGAGGLVVRSVDLAPPVWSGFDRFERNQWMYWLSAAVLVLCLFVVRNLIRSRRGLSITALRDNEIAATVCGVSAARDRISLFAISGGITAAGGSLYAMYIGALSPELSFTVFTSIQLITGLIIGGVATLLGPLAGGVAIVIIPAVTLDLANGQAYGLVFGIVLIVVVFLLPDGIVGRLQKMSVFKGTSQSPAHTST